MRSTAEGMGAFKQVERGVGCITSLTSVNSDVERSEVAVPDVVPRPQERTSSLKFTKQDQQKRLLRQTLGHLMTGLKNPL